MKKKKKNKRKFELVGMLRSGKIFYSDNKESQYVYPCGKRHYIKRDKYGKWHKQRYKFSKKLMKSLVKKGLVREYRGQNSCYCCYLKFYEYWYSGFDINLEKKY